MSAKVLYRGATERLFDQNARPALTEPLIVSRGSDGMFPGPPKLVGRVELQRGHARFAEQLFDATPMDRSH